MARLKRFELLTHCLEGSCSILLSYRRISGAGDGNRTHAASLEGWNSTIELHPHMRASRELTMIIIANEFRIVNTFFKVLGNLFIVFVSNNGYCIYFTHNLLISDRIWMIKRV